MHKAAPLATVDRAPAMRAAVAAMAVVALLASAGCAVVGPDYQAPATPLAAAFINAGASSTNTNPVAVDIATFWRGFNDAELNALVDRALQANGDVRVAQARLQESRALRSEIDAATLPTIEVDANGSRSVTPQAQARGLTRSRRTGSAFDAGFIANWELDFFGRAQRAKESAAAQLDASEADVGAALTSVAAEVARNYLALRGQQLRYRLTEEALANQRESLAIAQARVDAGRGTQLDLERALTLTASTEAALPALLAAIDLSCYRLATLSAEAPAALRLRLVDSVATANVAMTGTQNVKRNSTQNTAPIALPALSITDLAALPVGTPQQWLARRPDVAAAERQLASATADIGVTTGELYPSISLSGVLGLSSTQFGDLGGSESQRYSVGAGIRWTLLDFGRIRSRIKASEARALQRLATYEQTLGLALEETEGALSQFSRNAQRGASLVRAERSAGEARRLAQLRYEAGITDFLAVLDADREWLAARDARVLADVASAQALVAVYRALGGGWTVPAAASSSPIAATAAMGATPTPTPAVAAASAALRSAR